MVRGLVGGTLSFVNVMRELDLGAVQRQLAEPVKILVAGSELAEARRLADALFEATGPSAWSVAVAELSDQSLRDDRPDLVLLAVEPSEAPLDLLQRYRGLRTDPGTPAVAVMVDLKANIDSERETSEPAADFRLVRVPALDDDNLARLVASAVLELLPEQALALGRRFPAFRGGVSERLIIETSRANAQLALLSSLPASVPVVGGLVSGAADVVLLTKNQALLVYKLAGVHGRDLHDRVALAVEIAPVVGGAFLWRTVARTLLGMLPTVVGGLPKAAVAYAGTYLVGHLARYYYTTGHRPPPGLAAKFQAEGARLARDLASRLHRRRKG